MPTDPMCGMTIPEDGAITAEHEDRTYHFCSEGGGPASCRSTLKTLRGRAMT